MQKLKLVQSTRKMTASKQVIYSATCPPTTYSVMGGTPIAVEISQLTITPREMSKEEIEEATDKIDKSMELVKSLIETGNPIFEHKELEKLKSGLEAVAAVATIIQGITKIIDKPDNPLLEPLGKMAENIQKLGEKISENFKELKLLVSEVNFFSRILSPTSNLMRFWRDSIKNPGPEAVENFKRDYNKHPPLNLAYRFMAFLEQKTTNPLVTAMDAENAKTKATFQKWTTIYNRIFFNFMLLEAFATGLSIGTNDKEKLLDARQKVANSIAEWREAYKKDEAYFKEVSEWAKEFMRGSDKTNAEKADEIAKKLESYLTQDAHYVLVFDDCRHTREYGFYCPDESGLMISNYNNGRCSFVIYRSKTANSKTDEDYRKIKKATEEARDMDMIHEGNVVDSLVDQLTQDGMLLDRYSFSILVYKETHPEIRSANCPGREWGPGWWLSVTLTGHSDGVGYNFYLCASY